MSNSALAGTDPRHISLRPLAKLGFERIWSRLLALAYFSLGCLVPWSSAQMSASISGTVTDQSGAAVPGARVTVKNLDTGALREADTDAGGRYEVFALTVGSYEVRATKDGFAAFAAEFAWRWDSRPLSMSGCGLER